MEIFEELQRDFPQIQKDILLKNHTTFKIGGPAKYFLSTSDPEELKKAIEKCLSLDVKFYLLGGGSNVLINDKGFDGMIIAYKGDDYFEIKEENGFSYILVKASIPLSSLVIQFNNYTGLEWAIGIPGTLGGAVNGNAGAFNESISDSIESVNVLIIDDKKIVNEIFKKEDCEFGYRISKFKSNPNIIILSVLLRLKKGKEEDIKEKIKTNLEKRLAKQPKGFSAGSIFKNYFGKINEEIIFNDEELKKFNEKGIIPAGILIDRCGLRGKIIGNAKISEEHANFIINLGEATSDDVIELINLIKNEVQKKYFIELEEEIQIF